MEKEEEAVYTTIDKLFAELRIPYMHISRISKILCRKRPGIIPMLDRIIQTILFEVGEKWEKKDDIPAWFKKWWGNRKRMEVSPFIRMIRVDMLENEKTLKRYLSTPEPTKRKTGVPENASLLRIWESVVYWNELGGVPRLCDRFL